VKLVGVTGGLSAGKTSVCRFFKKLGAHVIDADRIVHALYENDKEVKAAVLRNFGTGAFTRGRVNRKKLGQIAFGSKKRLEKLCRLTHPKTIKRIKAEARNARKPVVIIDAPLLIESGLQRGMDAVVVVTASRAGRIRRSVGCRGPYEARGRAEDPRADASRKKNKIRGLCDKK
jgi:dephospho-CoA kinase